MKKGKKCKVDGCDDNQWSKGYCHKHYDQYRYYGHIPKRTRNTPNQVILCENHAEILFNKGGRCKIDVEDIDKINECVWRINKDGYAFNTSIGMMHRKILRLDKFKSGQKEVDHKNRDKLDNQKQNLRVVYHYINCHNRPKQEKNTSGYKGVDYVRRHDRWRARIGMKGKSIGNKEFKTLKEAVDFRKELENNGGVEYGNY